MIQAEDLGRGGCVLRRTSALLRAVHCWGHDQLPINNKFLVKAPVAVGFHACCERMGFPKLVWSLWEYGFPPKYFEQCENQEVAIGLGESFVPWICNSVIKIRFIILWNMGFGPVTCGSRSIKSDSYERNKGIKSGCRGRGERLLSLICELQGNLTNFMPFLLNDRILSTCHFGAYSFSFCHTFYVTNSCLIHFFGSSVLNLPDSCGFQHNAVFQDLFKLVDQRAVTALCWGCEVLSPCWSGTRVSSWETRRRNLANRENSGATALCSSGHVGLTQLLLLTHP